MAVNVRNFRTKYPIISSYFMPLKDVAKHHKSNNIVSSYGFGYLKWQTAKEFIDIFHRICIDYSYNDDGDETLRIKLLKTPDFEAGDDFQLANGYISMNSIFDYDDQVFNFLEKSLHELQFNKNLTVVLNEN